MSRKRLRRFATVLGILLLSVMIRMIAGYMQLPSHPSGMALTPPGFLALSHQSVEAQEGGGFLYEQAGISAYTQLSSPINLPTVIEFLDNIERREEEYVVGTIPAPGYEDKEGFEEKLDVHLLIRQDGWIVAYQLSWQTPAVIVDFAQYYSQEKTTTLATAIRKMADSLGNSVTNENIAYYSFEYPEATHLLLAYDSEGGNNDGTDNFTVKIPPELTIYEISTFHALDGENNGYESVAFLNNNQWSHLFGSGSGWKIFTEANQPINSFKGRLNTFSIFNEYYGYTSYVGVAIISSGGQE